MILLILFVLEFIFAVLELRRMYYEYRIRKISDNGSLPSVEFLLLMIYKHLLILGIDMQPGFKSEHDPGKDQGNFAGKYRMAVSEGK